MILVIMPCVLLRVGQGEGEFVPPLVSLPYPGHLCLLSAHSRCLCYAPPWEHVLPVMQVCCVADLCGCGAYQQLLLQVATEVVLLWIKQMFFALAVDGLGTFIYMTIEIIKV